MEPRTAFWQAHAAALLAIVAVMASWIPAHATAKIDPLHAVRST
jgi:hypothetical protein